MPQALHHVAGSQVLLLNSGLIRVPISFVIDFSSFLETRGPRTCSPRSPVPGPCVFAVLLASFPNSNWIPPPPPNTTNIPMPDIKRGPQLNHSLFPCANPAADFSVENAGQGGCNTQQGGKGRYLHPDTPAPFLPSLSVPNSSRARCVPPPAGQRARMTRHTRPMDSEWGDPRPRGLGRPPGGGEGIPSERQRLPQAGLSYRPPPHRSLECAWGSLEEGVPF